jgi:hypothetical protein
MATLLHSYKEPVTSPEGVSYLSQSCGRLAEDGLWEGWIEFLARDRHALRTPRETVQPNLVDLEYWATGLGPIYLEGALARASRESALMPHSAWGVHPLFEAPAAQRTRVSPLEAAFAAMDDEPTLD